MLKLSRLPHPTAFDSFAGVQSSKHISAVGAEQVSPARKRWVHDAKILRSAVGATHSAFVRAPRCRTTKECNREQAKHPRSAPGFNAGTGRNACATQTHAHPRIRASLDALRRRPRPAKRASLSAKSRLSGTKTRREWLRTNALALGIRLFVNAAAFSYWIAHPGAATHLFGSAGLPMNLTLEPGHATAAMFGSSGDSLMDWAAAKIPALQKEIPVVND